MISATAYPLTWPLKQPRTRSRIPGRFRVSLNRALDDLAEEIARNLGQHRTDHGRGRHWLLSSNIPVRRDGWPYASAREPTDPGVALYLTRKGGRQYVLPCDTYTTVAANVRAIHKTLEALRAIERHGSGGLAEQAYSGFAMLSDGGCKPWRAVLGIPAEANVTIEHVAKRYRELARKFHPDRGGDAERFREIVTAWEAAKGEL